MAEAQKKIPFTESQVMRRNLLITFVLLFLLVLLYAAIPGYNYAIKDVAIRNKEKIDQIETRRLNANMPELTMEDKRLFKIEDYWYIQFMRERTPTNAVILLPPHSAIDSTPEFNLLNSSEWMEYFLFPRLCISEDEKNRKPELYSKITHVAIVNGWGYDKLKYEPNGRPAATVLSIEPAKLDTTRQHQLEALKPVMLTDTSHEASTTQNPKYR